MQDTPHGQPHPVQRPLEPPRVDPVGLTAFPAGFRARPRRYGTRVRLAALVVLAAFLAAGTATTVASLGAWCLTSDAGSAPAPPVR